MSDTTWDPNAVGIEIRTPEGHFKCRCGASYWNATDIVDVVTCNVCGTAYKLAEPLGRAVDDRDQLAAAIQRVRALHKCRAGVGPFGDVEPTPAVCSTCNTAWPCETVRALDGEIDG